MRMRSVLSHSAQAVAEGALIALLVVGLAAGTTFAAKGGGAASGGGKHGGGGTGGSGSLVLVLAYDANGNGSANWGDSVTYTVTTSSTTSPYVSTVCKQGGIVVLSTNAGFFDSYPWQSARTVPLKTDRWTGGAASCVATLYSMDGGSQTNLSSLPFSAGA